MVAVRQTAKCLYPMAERHRGSNVDDVESAIVRMGTWCQVPCGKVVSVHHGNDPATPPRSTCNDMSYGDVTGAIGGEAQKIDREALHRITIMRCR